MKKLTLVHEASSGGLKQWSIWIEADGKTVTVMWGKVGKTLQTSSDTAKPKGKPGTASYMDERACALFNYERQIRKKREEGYREQDAVVGERDLFSGLDKQFVPAKPIADMDPADWPENVIIQRKRDGQRHLVLITRTGDVRIYSRRMDDMTAHFPKLAAYIRDANLPTCTVLDGEIIVDRDGSDDFKAVGTVTRAKAEKGAQREATLPIRYMVFDVLYAAGAATWKLPYRERYKTLKTLLPVQSFTLFVPLNLANAPVDGLMNLARAKGWEGFVVWFADEPTVVRDGGKPKRAGCAKLKVKHDQDVIATGYELGSGNQSDRVGAVLIAEYGPDGKLRDCGKCGSGFDMQTRKEALSWKYPVVIAIQSDGQEPTGKFRFPIFKKLHEDKVPSECIGPDLADLDECQS
jgi:bifunctional non-homologous end joining protein LigD